MPAKKEPPQSWQQRRGTIKDDAAIPFQRFEWACEWLSYYLSQWAFIDVLEYCGKLAVVATAVVYLFSGHERKQAAQDAKRSRQYVAWQTLNSAYGKPGDAGRRAALEDLAQGGVQLANLDVRGAILDSANLSGGKFHLSNWAHTELNEVVFAQKADLTTANFGDAKINRCHFDSSDLSRAIFIGAGLYNCSFNSANLNDVSFSNTIIQKCSFDSVSFSNVNFPNVTIVGASFKSSYLDHASFYSNTLQNANFDYASLESANFGACHLAACSFSSAKIDNGNFQSAVFTGANFMGAKGQNVSFEAMDATGALDFSFARFPNVKFSKSKLVNSNFMLADCTNSKFDGADVAGANFMGAYLVGADLKDLQNWRQIRIIGQAKIFGVKNAPEGFVEWAVQQGATTGKPPSYQEMWDEVQAKDK